MVTPVGNGCNVPTRPAPAPPGNSVSSRRNSAIVLESDKKYGMEFSRRAPSLSMQFRSQSTSDVSKKKKPPPRPPPPKIAGNKQKQNTSTIFSNLFRKNSTTASTRPTLKLDHGVDVAKAVSVSIPSVPVASLIDLHSPPSSPTFTTRSSSDGVSVDSLSSDNGNTSASGNYGTGSQVESGFEDDFSLFPSPLDNKPIDPFSPLPKTSCVNPAFQLSNDDPKLKIKAVDLPAFRNPTIIRTKQSKAPLRPPLPTISQNSNFSSSPWMPQSNSSTTPLDSPSINFTNDFSPPMPSVPPPPPPVEVLQVLSSGPPVPPRPSFQFKPSKEVEAESERPYCIALYDYVADHESDLSFKENDVILLTKEVNEEWFMGCLNGLEGMFPSNYVEVKVPLKNENVGNSSHQKVIAIFDFHAESWDDLSFQEGDEISVLEEVNKDWLYGAIGDRKGQFPTSFVSPLPDS